MKFLVFIFFFIMSLASSFGAIKYTLDGKQFVDCFQRAFNQTIYEYRTNAIAVTTDKKLKGLCRELPISNYKNLVNNFIEKDRDSNVEVPFDAEDMSGAQLSEIYGYFKSKIQCYRKYKSSLQFITKTANLAPVKKDSNLLKAVFNKMLGTDYEKNRRKTLSQFSFGYCKNNI